MKTHPVISLFRWIINLALGICVVLYFFSSGKVTALPNTENLTHAVLSSPIQKSTSAENFTFNYRGVEYGVDPVASYDISGVLVSHNNIHAWWDYYHDENSVDIKDLCLIWGENLESGSYHQGTYYNESVSCHASFERGASFEPFGLSNNHIISDDEEVRETVRQMKVGDQVRLKGLLVNYYPADRPEFVRKSSTVRTDDGGGACEILFVRDAEILSEYDRTWHRVFNFTDRALLPLVLIKVLTFLIFPWIEFKLT